LTNGDLEKMVDTSDEWITSRTGIKERRLAAPDEFTSDLATQAALKAMASAGMSAGLGLGLGMAAAGQAYPPGYPPQGYPPPGYPPPGYPPPQGYTPAQGYPPPGYPPQGYGAAPPQQYAPPPGAAAHRLSRAQCRNHRRPVNDRPHPLGCRRSHPRRPVRGHGALGQQPRRVRHQ